MTAHTRFRHIAAAAAAVAIAGTAGFAASAADTSESWSSAAAYAWQHPVGPDPTPSSVVKDGPFTVTKKPMPVKLGGTNGTLYFPANPPAGKRLGGIVTIPGFMEPGVTMELYGRRMASHGFVVLVADASGFTDQPEQRAKTAQAAVQALQSEPTVANLLDPQRIALVGHSMGGGGVLLAAQQTNLRAVIAVHPWSQQPQFSGVNEPTMVIAGLLDFVAPVPQHAAPIYASLTNAPFKAMLTHLTGTHWAGVADDKAIMGRALAFLKYYVDGDTRYQGFLCAKAPAGTTFVSNCVQG